MEAELPKPTSCGKRSMVVLPVSKHLSVYEQSTGLLSFRCTDCSLDIQVDMLWISDPKALQYVIQTSGYNFPKQPERRAISRLLTDHGLSWAEGQRIDDRILKPISSYP